MQDRRKFPARGEKSPKRRIGGNFLHGARNLRKAGSAEISRMVREIPAEGSAQISGALGEICDKDRWWSGRCLYSWSSWDSDYYFRHILLWKYWNFVRIGGG